MLYLVFVAAVLTFSSCFAGVVQEKFIPVENAELYCKVMGSGKPLIVLHGGAGYLTHDYLLPHLERLSEDNLVVFYDQRGLGKSTGELTPGQINLKTYVDDIESIRKFLGVTRVSLIGHSWGGLLAMKYALSYPESVDRIILTNSMTASSDDLGLFFAELARRIAPYQNEIHELEAGALFQAGDPETVAHVSQLYFQTYMYNPENVKKLKLCKTQKENINGAKVWEIFKNQIFMQPFDILSEIKGVKCPTLIIHGNEDVMPLTSSEHIHDAIGSSALIKIEQCGHFPFVEQPEPFFNAINTFLK